VRINFPQIAQTTVRAATAAGATAIATITRPAPPPHPLTGVQSGGSLTQTVDVVQTMARKIAKSNDAAWSTVRTEMFVAANAAQFTPARGDLVTFAGRAGRLEAIEEYAPTGTPLGWFLGVGA
jgi:hypothetical protein